MKKCCFCCGGSPSYRCSCACHRQEDCEYWEVMAFVWIYDAPHEQARNEQWRRFCMAYPEHAHESCDHFWKRIQQTRWYHKHRHNYDIDDRHEYGVDTGKKKKVRQ